MILLKFPDKLIRKLILLFDKDYVKKKIGRRKGSCKKCGECCGNCRFLDSKTRLCKVYNKRPWTCYKDFPLDDMDKRIWAVEKCGYKFR